MAPRRHLTNSQLTVAIQQLRVKSEIRPFHFPPVSVAVPSVPLSKKSELFLIFILITNYDVYQVPNTSLKNPKSELHFALLLSHCTEYETKYRSTCTEYVVFADRARVPGAVHRRPLAVRSPLLAERWSAGGESRVASARNQKTQYW